jgi:rhamnose transport system permease protein
VAPSFFAPENLRDIALNNAPLLLVATGMTLVILVGGSTSRSARSSRSSASLPACSPSRSRNAAVAAERIGDRRRTRSAERPARGAAGLPSIIATLATLVAWRDGLRWATEGAWVQDLPPDFQWFGLGQASGQLLIVLAALAVLIALDFLLHHVAGGRAVYAVGSDREAARLAGIEPERVTFLVFVLMGALTGLAAFLNAARFSAVPSNIGIGLELKAIAAVVVGRHGDPRRPRQPDRNARRRGAARHDRPGLTYAGINPFWEKAVQGAIILAALASDRVLGRLERHALAIAR